jgi:Fe-S cluster assembly protein SufD
VTRLTTALLEFDEPSWRREQRVAALGIWKDRGLPDPADDVWKYAPLNELTLEDLELATPSQATAGAAAIGGGAPAVVAYVSGGHVIDIATNDEIDGLTVSTEAPPTELGRLVGPDDAFAAMNLAYSPGAIFVDVAPSARIERPVVLLVDCPEGASFPRVLVRVGERGSVRVLEHVTGPSASFVASVAEYVVGAGATLEVASVQSLGTSCWSVARTRASIGAGATFRQVAVGLGARYDRVRADALLEGEGATSELQTAHVGTGDQVHDLRTMQVHTGRRTISRLHSKAAVTDRSGSIYSGLITMRHGAKKADARQVNNSLVLSEEARADSVPNLDIEENDVQCAHASTVGPLDPEQRWYLESRGVDPVDAVQLIITGFFHEIEGLLHDDVLAARLHDAISGLSSRRGDDSHRTGGGGR